MAKILRNSRVKIEKSKKLENFKKFRKNEFNRKIFQNSDKQVEKPISSLKVLYPV